jgi:hypothetical protein
MRSTLSRHRKNVLGSITMDDRKHNLISNFVLTSFFFCFQKNIYDGDMTIQLICFMVITITHSLTI